MSTNRCLSTRCLQLLPCARPATMSTLRSGAAATASESSPPSDRKDASSQSTVIARPSRRAAHASHRKGALRLCMEPLASWRRCCARRTRNAPVYDGILIDCGVSSPQLDNPARGFSFQKDGPLDMRMDPQCGEPVSDWLARASFEEMRNVIASFGQERFARRIASAIERERAGTPLTRTAQLAALIQRAVPVREPGKHAATRTFQALRMMINDELGQLQRALEQALTLLAVGGRLAVISFHSLEDGVVRDFMNAHSTVDPLLARLPMIPATAMPRLRRIGRKQRASAAEVAFNPRARSALLRVAEFLGPVAK